jgi:hypothetical protein
MMLSSNHQNPHNESKNQQLTLVKKTIAAPVHTPKSWVRIGQASISVITQYLSMDDASHLLAQTCRFFHHHYKQTIFDQQKLETLAHHVIVKPNEVKMVAMLNCEPTLINAVIKKVVVGEGDSKKTFLNNTIFQLAYGAEDHDMCFAMKPFFLKVYGNEAAALQEMDRQHNEKFAENKEEGERKEMQAKTTLESLLEPVIQVITNEEFNLGRDANNKLILSDATMDAINIFRRKFADSQAKIIEKGPHFRNNILLNIYNAYIQAAETQWHNNYNKYALFEDGIISYVFLFVPVNVAQKFVQGLYYLQDMEKHFTRLNTLKASDNDFYTVLRSPSLDFALAGSCIDVGVGGSRKLGGNNFIRIDKPREYISKLISNTSIKLVELMQPEPKSRCIIC